MNEKEKSTRSRQSGDSAPKRTYRRRTAPKDTETKEKKAVVKADKTSEVKTKSRSRQPKEIKKTPVRIIPLGGLNEIGKNMTVFECSNDMFILDCGLAFPDADMPGVDIVIPQLLPVEATTHPQRALNLPRLCLT